MLGLDAQIAEATRAVATDPDNAKRHYRLGVLHERAGDLEDAGASLLRAVQLEPKNREIRTRLRRVWKRAPDNIPLLDVDIGGWISEEVDRARRAGDENRHEIFIAIRDYYIAHDDAEHLEAYERLAIRLMALVVTNNWDRFDISTIERQVELEAAIAQFLPEPGVRFRLEVTEAEADSKAEPDQLVRMTHLGLTYDLAGRAKDAVAQYAAVTALEPRDEPILDHICRRHPHHVALLSWYMEGVIRSRRVNTDVADSLADDVRKWRTGPGSELGVTRAAMVDYFKSLKPGGNLHDDVHRAYMVDRALKRIGEDV